MTVGQNIKRLRKLKGITQGELEKLSGVKFSNISKYENEEIKNIPYDSIVALAKGLNVHPGELMGWIKSTKLDPFKSLEATVNEIKKQTGLLKFSELPLEIQIQLELASRKAVQDYFDNIIV